MLTTSALYNRAQKVLRVRPSRAMKPSSSCELTPRVLSPPPCQLPPGPWTSLASSALCLDCLHANPSTTSVEQRAEACPYPTTVRLSGCRLRPTSSKGAAKRRVKSGNFNWFYRQFYYALNSSCFNLVTPSTTLSLMRVAFHSTSCNVVVGTYLGILFILSPYAPVTPGHPAAKS